MFDPTTRIALFIEQSIGAISGFCELCDTIFSSLSINQTMYGQNGRVWFANESEESGLCM